MLRDVFYYGAKPNAHPRERFAENLEHARSLATTEHFWIVNEFCDYTNFEWDFDFDFLPDEDVWAENHINVWPSVYQKDSGTWLVANNDSELIIYRNDVNKLKRKNIETNNWRSLDKIDKLKFDFGWHPDPTDPPYIYRWGNKYYPVELMGAIEYHVDGATEVKYMKSVVELAPDWEKWQIPNYVDLTSFDFNWRPDPREPAFIYDFGTQWHKAGGPRYVCEGAVQVKYIEGMPAKALPQYNTNCWHILEGIELEHFDYTWYPDPTAEPYIYVFGNQHYKPEIMPTVEYRVPGATERKYVHNCWATLKSDLTNWDIPDNIDIDSFDFSWVPNPHDPPYIYQFGTQWQKTGGPRYVVEGATELKYIEGSKAKAKQADLDNWHILDGLKVKHFDYSWHPDQTEEPYIYVFGNKFYDAEICPTIEYRPPGATQKKYVKDTVAELETNFTNWSVPENIDISAFDFSWIPDPGEPPYIYQFGTQHQKTGGPRYITPGATEIKYIDTQTAVALAQPEKFRIVCDAKIKDFDYSWHPDQTEQPYIYTFGNNLYPAQVMPTIEYIIEGSTEVKYVHDIVARLDVNTNNWEIPDNIDVSDFDFSWIPNPRDPALIYQFGTQHQKTGGPRYVTPGATNIKYVPDQKARSLPSMEHWVLLEGFNLRYFDYSWHPDETEDPYIYVFGNQYYDAEICPTIEYRMPGATQKKYIKDVVVILGKNNKNWIVKPSIDTRNFDFSWIPNPYDPPYIYEFGTQHQKTGGPRYVVEGATEIKYVDFQKAVTLPSRDNWLVPEYIDTTSFDFSWHPDSTETGFLYEFGTQHQKTGGPIYVTKGAEKTKFVDTQIAKAKPDRSKWYIPEHIDVSKFDFSWHPPKDDKPYIYQFGTQWQKTGGPRYIVEENAEIKYVEKSAKKLPEKSKFKLLADVMIEDFDYSWHPDESAPPYIYVFGSQFYDAEIMPILEYRVEGASHVKHINDVKVKLAPNKSKWLIPDNIDDTNFDYSWIPNPNDPPYIYVSGTQHQKTGGPRYVVDGATEIKYIDQKVTRLEDKTKFTLIADVMIKDFDFSWHPDETEPPYIYIFGNNFYPAEEMPTIEYRVEGALHVKHINDIKVILAPNKDSWVIPTNIDDSEFDYSWIPNPNDPPYMYIAGTQHQKTGGPRYVVDGAIGVKYIDQKVKRLPDISKFEIIADVAIEDFDYSWHPDDNDPPYIYVFGNNQYDAETMPTLQYKTHDATFIKYINEVKATLASNKKNWVIPADIDDTGFDYSWIPNPKAPPYIYQFGTQWQKTGGPRYVVEGGTEVKYIGRSVKRLSDKSKFTHINDYIIEDFDYSWHPDETEPPYIYAFGNQHYQSEIMPTIEYRVEGATTYKYLSLPIATLGQDKRNWIIPKNIDVSEFDFSWKPDPNDPPYIYRFGTQWQKTGGPSYNVEGATDVKYVTGSKAKFISNPDDPRWKIPENVDSSEFDFSWHPDSTERPYIYQFGTQWQKTGGPRYVMPGASTVKYVEGNIVKKLPDGTYWDIPDNIDIDSFDFSWHPDDSAPPYIYQFGTQWQKTGGPRYVHPDSDEKTEVMYINKPNAIRLSNKQNWSVPENIDPASIDYSWHPDDTEEPYIYQFGTQWHDRGGPKYSVPGATSYKYVNDIKGKLYPNKSKWDSLLPIDEDKFDYTWAPHPFDPPYIYVFGNQWNPPEIEPTMEYMVEGATEIKYVHELKANVLPDKRLWTILRPIIEESFDFSWRPNPKDPPYIYVFGNNQYSAEKMPTLEYRIEGATEYKFIHDIKAELAPVMDRWNIIIPIDKQKFDFSWAPDPGDPPYIYVFGNQWHRAEIEPTIEYRVPGADEVKYVQDIVAHVLPEMNRWVIPDNIDVEGFDLSWRPDPKSPPYIYEFATIWNNRGGPKYMVDSAIDFKYIENIKAKTKATRKNWIIPKGVNVEDFDFTWVPHPDSPPVIYQFGTLVNDNDGPRYDVPNNTGEVVRLLRVYRRYDYREDIIEKDIPRYLITSKLEDLISQHPDEIFWAIRENIDYSNFDFTWKPSIEQARYVHVFGSPDSELTQTYFVSAPMYNQGFTDFNFVEGERKADEEYLATLFKPSDMFFVDRGNFEAKERFEKLKEKYPGIQRTRFLNSWADTISRCINRSNTELCWILNSELDYTDFNFNYYPNEWQLKMVHIFGTQWSHWGTTYMVNRDTFANDTKYVKVIEHLNNLNFVKDRIAIATNNLYDVLLIDHGTNNIDEIKEKLLRKVNGKSITVVEYDTNYLTTLKNFIKKLPEKKDHYIWVCSSVCNYDNFEFSFITDPFARDNLHVFASDQQKFGDTFLLDVNIARNAIDNIDKLQAYPKVSYITHIKANRLPAPVIKVDSDTHVGALNVDFNFPYMIFATEDIDTKDYEHINLWEPDTKNIIVTSTGASRIIVPREAKDIVKNELYDYPYIKTASKLSKSKPLDIVFLSNGELCADENYEHLLAVTKGLGNRVVRVDGVDGRVQGYHAALEASETPWAFTVFAKLKVNNKFDWGWQPDRLQIPKHYIFNAKNPVTGLIYGHQAMIAYNKKLTLANMGKGLDFTLDDPHESVDLLSGVATFNTDPYSTWRTAFREVVKLKSDYSEIAEERLNAWLTLGEGDFAENCLQGANDAVEFYDSVMGDIEELKKSYEWAWLKDYYRSKYK